MFRILEQQNRDNVSEINPTGVLISTPSNTDGSSIWPISVQQLESLRQRGWMSMYNGTHLLPGPITIVGMDDTPFDLVPNSSNTYYNKTSTNITITTANRFISYDAPLLSLSTIYNASNSIYASAPLARSHGQNLIRRTE